MATGAKGMCPPALLSMEMYIVYSLKLLCPGMLPSYMPLSVQWLSTIVGIVTVTSAAITQQVKVVTQGICDNNMWCICKVCTCTIFYDVSHYMQC